MHAIDDRCGLPAHGFGRAWASSAAGSAYSMAVIRKTKPVLYWELNEASGPANDLAMDPPGGSNDEPMDATLGGPGPGPATACPSRIPAMRHRASTGGAVRCVRLTTAVHVPVDRYIAQCWFLSRRRFIPTPPKRDSGEAIAWAGAIPWASAAR